MRRLLPFLLLAACESGVDHWHPGIERGPLPPNALVVCAAGSTVKGVDVSHWDGTLDWAKIAGAGQVFGIAKATEGVTFKDPKFLENWAAIKNAGMVRGAYHFFRPNQSGTAQAKFYLSTVGAFAAGDLPPVVDWETTDSIDNATDAARMQEFVDEIKAETGLTTIMYTSARFLGTIGNPTGFASIPLWDAHWNVTCPNIPNAWATWAFWQTGGADGMPGTTTTIDVNLFNGSRAQLEAITVPAVTPDAGPADAGPADAGELDAGPADAGEFDAGSDDAGPIDADAGAPDAGRADAGPGDPPAASVTLGCSSSSGAWAALWPLLALVVLRRLTPRRP